MTREDGKYISSRFIRRIKIGDNSELVYHSLRGNPMIIDSGAREILKIFSQPKSIDAFLGECELDIESMEVLKQLINDGFLVHSSEDVREYFFEDVSNKITDAIKGKELRVLDLSVSELCNFGCKYCVHSRAIKLDRSRMGQTGFMTMEMAQTAVDAFLLHIDHNNIQEWDLHFGSAESLLNFEVIKWAIEYLQKNQRLPKSISLNSNLSLLTKKMAEFFRDNNFRVNTSIDGLSDVNDLVRIYKDGHKTSIDIIKGMNLLKEIGYQINSVGITLCDENFEKVDTEIISWLKDWSISNALFDIDFVNMVGLDPEKAADKMVRLEERCRQEGILAEGFWKTPYKNIRDSGISGASRFCSSLMGNNLLVTPSGNLYICSYSSTPVGHISDFPNCLRKGPFRKILLNSSVANFSECRDCELEGHCLGGCLLTREGGKNQNQKVAQMCAFYRATTKKLLKLDAKK